MLVSLRTQGIQFDAERLLDLGLDPATLYPHCVDRALDVPQEKPFPISTNPGPEVGVAPSEGTAVDEKGKGSMEKDPSEFSDADAGEKRVAASPSPKPVPVTRLVEEEKRAANISVDGTLIGDGDGDEFPARSVHVDTVRRAKTKTMTETETDFTSVDAVDVVHKSKTRTEDEDEEDSPGGVEDEKAYIRAVVESEFEATERVVEVDDEDEAAADDVYRIPVEDEEDRKDALQREYDQLQAAWYWWILEFMPLRERVRRPDGTWKKKWWYVPSSFRPVLDSFSFIPLSPLHCLLNPPPPFPRPLPLLHINSSLPYRIDSLGFLRSN